MRCYARSLATPADAQGHYRHKFSRSPTIDHQRCSDLMMDDTDIPKTRLANLPPNVLLGSRVRVLMMRRLVRHGDD